MFGTPNLTNDPTWVRTLLGVSYEGTFRDASLFQVMGFSFRSSDVLVTVETNLGIVSIVPFDLISMMLSFLGHSRSNDLKEKIIEINVAQLFLLLVSICPSFMFFHLSVIAESEWRLRFA